MKKNDWDLKIRKATNGLVIRDKEGNEILVQEREQDELFAAEDLLNRIIEYLNLRGDPFGQEQIRVIRDVGEEYTLQKGEKIVRQDYSRVVTKNPPKLI